MSFDFGWPAVVVSGDIDWASEACISDSFEFFSNLGVKPSFFATHESETMSRLSAEGKIEVGVHPNFLPGSSHGSNIGEVVDAVMRIAPSAQGFRSHGFVDSTQIARTFRERGLRWDSNLCLYLQDNIVPLRHCSGLLRLPVFWADDVHMMLASDDWNVETIFKHFLTPGLKILDIHPIHLALNSCNHEFYLRHKSRTASLSSEDIQSVRHRGPGTRTFVAEIIGRLRDADVRFYTFEQILGLSSDPEHKAGAVAGRSDSISSADHQRYWSLSPSERQEILKGLYNKRDSRDPYATSRDHNQRELEIDAILRSLPQGRLDKVVDLGCGNGYTLISLAKSIDAEKLIGVDFAEQLIDGARELAAGMSGELKSPPEFICGDALAYTRSLESNSVDCVITERFLLNLPDQKTQNDEIREIFRTLRPGGRLLMCEGSLEGFNALNDLRSAMQLPIIPETSADNLSSLRFNDEVIERFVTEDVGFEDLGKLGFSIFFSISRGLYPKLIAPQKPQFDARINSIAREIQQMLPMTPGIGSNVLWVLRKPEGV